MFGRFACNRFLPCLVLLACALDETPALALSLDAGTTGCDAWASSLLGDGAPAVKALPALLPEAVVSVFCLAGLLARLFFPRPVLRACVLGEAPELTLSLGSGTLRCSDWTPSLLNGGAAAVEAHVSFPFSIGMILTK